MQNEPHANNLCGAKTRSGEPCKNKAMPNGRCRMHGGKSTGAPPAKLKKNTNSKKHGLFAKYLPQETMEIMNDIETMGPADILWMNIKMQFASIVRAQQIMYVEDINDRTETLKKLKVENTETREGHTQIPIEKEYEIEQAWNKQATFMQSLSRSMAELRNMLKQFRDMAYEDDIRLLEIEKMEVTIDKAKAETEKLSSDDGSNQPIQIMIKRKGDTS
ncbi:phage terminase small subunit [Oceanobacillus sp. FSL W7-1281]|uniref:phage terminase small subunit n=1 Tax=Oceanobacillus sp. FSL W7-1281 TaxID=2921698 RepID=UPI0030DCDEAD